MRVFTKIVIETQRTSLMYTSQYDTFCLREIGTSFTLYTQWIPNRNEIYHIYIYILNEAPIILKNLGGLIYKFSWRCPK